MKDLWCYVRHYLRHIGVLALVFGLVVFCENPKLFPSRAARSGVARVEIAIFFYELDTGTFPTEAQGLRALIMNPGVPGWRGPYVNGAVIPPDPWGNPYRYRLVDDKPVIDSAGPDGKLGTPDDIRTEIKP